jgi:hypothetical protein
MRRKPIHCGLVLLLGACHSSSGGSDVPGGSDDVDDGDGPDAGESSDAPPGTCTDDVLGVKQVYCTKPAGDEWFMNMSDPEEDLARFNPKTELTRNPDGSWKVTSEKVRMNVFTRDGYDQNLITTYDQDELAAKGYMQSPGDWRDVEMTGYVRVNSADGGGFAWYAHGGYHGENAGDGGSGCEGTSYKGGLSYNGTTRIAKEQWHPHGYSFTERKPAQDGSLVDRWVGFKTVMYNIDSDRAVKLELWADWDANNTWVKIDETTDATGMGSEGGECGGKSDQPMIWGGPIATFRWDGASDVDIKNFSVREILPSRQP